MDENEMNNSTLAGDISPWSDHYLLYRSYDHTDGAKEHWLAQVKFSGGKWIIRESVTVDYSI